MKVFSTGLLALGLVATALGVAIPKDDNGVVETDYDAIIVGGGPAGLSALSGLARVRRKVLLIDSGEYRNGRTRHMHDVIGFDGKDAPSATGEKHTYNLYRCHPGMVPLRSPPTDLVLRYGRDEERHSEQD